MTGRQLMQYDRLPRGGKSGRWRLAQCERDALRRPRSHQLAGPVLSTIKAGKTKLQRQPVGTQYTLASSASTVAAAEMPIAAARLLASPALLSGFMA
ncbi:MAG TPA: hypothetical protein DCR15_18295 [Arthrobacter bacterium]|nr:hypothetical protein [Arthrobacter sp.]